MHINRMGSVHEEPESLHTLNLVRLRGNLMKNTWFIRAALVFALACLALFAQSDLGSITGFVKDPTGAVIPNAAVTVRNETTGTERKATTNESGSFTVTNIPAGFYTVDVEAKGFKKFESTHNKLDPSAPRALEASLTVGAATETVEVTATAVALQTESASVQKLVTRQQIDALELNGRNPVGLASLVPGARGGNLAGLSFAFNQGPSNFNGSRDPGKPITPYRPPRHPTPSKCPNPGSAGT